MKINSPQLKRRLVAGGQIAGAIMFAGSIGGCAVQAATGNLCRQANGSYLDAIGRKGSDCSPLRGTTQIVEVLGSVTGSYVLMRTSASRSLS